MDVPELLDREPHGGGVVPDGNRHIAAIYYFAEQPLLHGPIIRDMDSNAMWIGDLERFPSYLYYYLLSFPVRIAMMMGAPDAVNVLLIRLIGIVFGVIVLLTLRKIVHEIVGPFSPETIWSNYVPK